MMIMIVLYVLDTLQCVLWVRKTTIWAKKKTVLFRPVNNRLKSVKFTKMFSVQCSMFQPCACVCVCADVYFYFITNTGFCVWCCVLCIFVLALLYQSYGIFFKFHTHEWFAFWYADKNIFCLSIDTKKHRHHQHYIHSMLFMLCKLHLYHFLLNWITLFFSLIILSQPSSRCPFSFLEFLLSFRMIECGYSRKHFIFFFQINK